VRYQRLHVIGELEVANHILLKIAATHQHIPVGVPTHTQ